MLIGYARISTQDQNLELQRKALIDAGCEKIFDDKVSGSRSERPGLAQALGMLRDGDTLVVWKLDSPIRRRCANDTSKASGRFFFHVMESMRKFRQIF
jgi:DNA invertase Pin-like site-specific DNA recombinase